MSKFEDIYLKGKDIIDIIYPIGCIYMSFNAIDPSTLYSGTEWERIKGKFLVGVDEDDTDINISAIEGGEKEHLLLESEMPVHNHQQYVTANTGGPSIRCDYSSDARGILYPQGCNTGNAGGNQAHNNMPPYIAVYMWKRIS